MKDSEDTTIDRETETKRNKDKERECMCDRKRGREGREDLGRISKRNFFICS